MDKNKSHNMYTVQAELSNNGPMYRPSTSAISEKNGRFPYASTPSVSPNIHPDEANVNALQLRKSNMKLLVGSLAQSESFCGEEMQMDASRRYVTARNRYLTEHDSTGVSISPIAGNNDRRQLFTDKKGETPQCRQQNSNYIASRDVSYMTLLNPGIEMGLSQNTSSNNSVSAPTTVYPYPTITVMDSMDSFDILSKHLQILAAFRHHDLQRQQLTCPKKKDKGDDKFILYKFTKETFLNVNSEASIHALYLLFNNICSKEFEQRFRDCWPVYEKKFEGIFRRVALEWMKELIEANPTFFHGIRVESLGGLLVNPGGERFVSMLRQLCRYVMYVVATRKKDRRQILTPPIPTSDPEVTNRQLHVLQTRVENFMEDALKKYKNMVLNECTVAKSFEDLDALSEQLAHDEALLAARLKSCVLNHPDIFNMVSEDEWKVRDADMLTLQIMDDQPYEDILKDMIDDCLQRCADKIYKPVSLLQDIIKDYDKIWHVLETDKTKPVILDCNKFNKKQIHTESGSPSLNTFIQNLIDSANNILPDLNSLQTVPKDILEEYNSVQLRMDYLNMLATKVKESSFECKDAMSAAKDNKECVKLRLDGFPWSTLSKVPDKESINHLDMTPMRVFDINRVSGRTPGMNNFLDSSSSCSSGDNTTVVKRGRASTKIRREGDDSIDGPNFGKNKSSFQFGRKGLFSNSLGSDHLLSTPVSTEGSSNRNILQQIGIRSSCERSLLDTPETSLNASTISISGRLSMATTIASATPASNAIHKFDPSYSSIKDMSCISTVSDFDTSSSNLSAHLRVSKILESIANKTCEHELNSSPSNGNGLDDNVKNVSIIKSKNAETDYFKDELNDEGLVSCFATDDVNDVMENWKGIMETSHIEMDSDSDDC